MHRVCSPPPLDPRMNYILNLTAMLINVLSHLATILYSNKNLILCESILKYIFYSMKNKIHSCNILNQIKNSIIIKIDNLYGFFCRLIYVYIEFKKKKQE